MSNNEMLKWLLKNHKKDEKVTIFTYLSIICTFSVLLVQIYSYVYNISFASYYNIPREYVSYQLHNNILSNLFYFIGLSIVMIILFVINRVHYMKARNKIVYLIKVFVILFILIFIILVLWYSIEYDINFFKEIMYANEDNKQIVLPFAIILFVFTFSIWILLNIYYIVEIMVNRYLKNKKNIIKVRKQTSNSINNKNDQNRKNKTNIFNYLVIIYSIMFLLLYFIILGYLMGKSQAKSNRIFWVTSNNNMDSIVNLQYVKLYEENRLEVYAPCIISTSSILIDNRKIVRRMGYEGVLRKYEFKNINLVVKSTNNLDEKSEKEFELLCKKNKNLHCDMEQFIE